jgi:DNA-binding beta-propeller fold protein YncE
MGGEVKMMRILVTVLFAVVLVAACGKAQGGTLPTSGDYKLYEAASTQSAQLVSVIDSRSHSVERSLPLGTPSPDWTHLYSVNSRTLVDINPQTGATSHSVQLPGDFQLPMATLSGVPGGLAQNGHWLVLEAFDSTSGSVPSGTHLLLVDTSYSQATRQVDLPGYFQFDAVSNDGQWIYLIQFVFDTTEYHVRRYDMAAGQLDPTIIFDKSDGSAAMTGLRLSGVASPDGHWLYSLYARQDQSAFIHILSLDAPIAFCLDLPGSGYAADPDSFRWSLALSRDGSHLYAANGAMGAVVDVNTTAYGPSITRIVRAASTGSADNLFAQNVLAKEFGANGSVLSPDGRTLVMSGSTGVVWVDASTLHAQSRQLTDWNVWSLALSPDGSKLYVVNDAGRIAEVSMAGSHTATTFAGGPGQPLALIRVEAPGP